jgi:hypothetical protein
LLAHCIARAVIDAQGGIDVAMEKYGPKAERLSKWAALKVVARVTPKASRVAAFVVMWAIAMRDERKDEYSITEYMRYWVEDERQAYRTQNEFRDLWPEFDTPNELAGQILKHIDDGKLGKVEVATLPSRLMVVA